MAIMGTRVNHENHDYHDSPLRHVGMPEYRISNEIMAIMGTRVNHENHDYHDFATGNAWDTFPC